MLIDVYGKISAALETLRQSISEGEILTFDTYHFKLLSARAISFMATCCVFGSDNRHSNVISLRLSRLFSIFVLPSLSMDVILSIHSPRLKIWLKDMPLQHSDKDMAHCIITATKSLYLAVCDQYQPTVQRPHFIFSHHDIERVFCGMCLWRPNIPNTGAMQRKENSPTGCPPLLPGPAASVRDIVRLWMHECMRTFSDRLCSEDENKAFVSLLAKTATTHYGMRLVDEPQPFCEDDPPTVKSPAVHKLLLDTAGACKPTSQNVDAPNPRHDSTAADQLDLKKDQSLTEPSFLSEDNCSKEASLKTDPLQPQVRQHLEAMMAKLVYGPDLSEALKFANQQQNFRCGRSYRDQDFDVLMQGLRAIIDQKQEDEGQKFDNECNFTTRFVVHKQRVNQLLHILRALLVPGGHGVLIGSDRGTGRKTNVRLAALLTGYQLMEVHPDNENKLHEILKEAGNQTRADGVHVVILVHEGVTQSVREELLVAMSHRNYPGLYTEEEMRNLITRVTAVKNSRRFLMDSWMFEK